MIIRDSRFLNVLLANGLTFLYTPDRLQPAETNTCGLYAIYFVVRLYRDVSVKDVLKVFGRQQSLNNLRCDYKSKNVRISNKESS